MIDMKKCELLTTPMERNAVVQLRNSRDPAVNVFYRKNIYSSMYSATCIQTKIVYAVGTRVEDDGSEM